MLTAIIFDLDDTLLPCGKYYRAVQDKFAEYQSQRLGIPKQVCSKILSDIDLTAISLPNAFSRNRYPRSFFAASVALDTLSGNEISKNAAHISFDIGDSVFAAPYNLFDGVFELLQDYAQKYELYILTKGDTEVQKQKIIRNNLHTFIPWERIHVVPTKNPENITKILLDNNLGILNTIMVGDSLKDDIAHAAAIGMETVWVSGHANKSWAYENSTDIMPSYTIDTVTHLPTIISI